MGCLVTNQIKDYPFEVILHDGLPVSGVILADQIKMLDWRVLDAEWKCTLPHRVVTEVLQKLVYCYHDKDAGLTRDFASKNSFYTFLLNECEIKN